MKILKTTVRAILTLAVGAGLITITAHAQYVGPDAGQKVAFLGDSITCFGVDPGGWITLVADALEQNGKKIVIEPAGLPGNTSKDMLRREPDVLYFKPDWMTLSCGVNDVWHGADGASLDEYKQAVTTMVDKAEAAGVKVVILTPTMIGEVQSDPNNQKLVAYIDFLRVLASQRHLMLIDLNSAMQTTLAEIKSQNPKLKGNLLTKDGVHPNGPGNEMMASCVLKAFGFTDPQLAKLKESWLDLPTGVPLKLVQPLTIDQYIQLRAMAAKQDQTIEEMLAGDLSKVAQDQVNSASTGSTNP